MCYNKVIKGQRKSKSNKNNDQDKKKRSEVDHESQ